MTDQGRGGELRARARRAALGRDARILQGALRRAIGASPESFLKTVQYVEAQPLDYWINEIRSSTWAVAQRNEEVVGVVAGKLPDSEKDAEDQAFTRYIESVWITPELRRKGVGKRLIHYLLETEYRKNRHIRQFLLWVFANNDSAIKMYEHMGFKATPERKILHRTGHATTEIEIKYCLDFDAAVHVVHEAARRLDRHRYGVTYRILGEQY